MRIAPKSREFELMLLEKSGFYIPIRVLSRLLDRIEKSGWITRKRGEKDRRQVVTFITDSGKKLLSKIEDPFTAQMQGLADGVKTADLKNLLNVLAQIRTRCSKLS